MKYFEEQKQWDEVVTTQIGSDSKLIHVSVQSSDSRVYASSQGVFKVRRQTPASRRGRGNSLEDEFLILKRLSNVPGIPRPHSYWRRGNWEILGMDSLPALRSYDPTMGQPRERLRDFWAVMRVTAQINRVGCSHGDLHSANVGRNVEGTLSFFDFDQACLANPWRCRLRDFLGLPTCDWRSMNSLFQRTRFVRALSLVYWLPRALKEILLLPVRLLQKWRGYSTITPETDVRNRTNILGDPDLQLLANAWELAAQSDASSPGIHRAYYSIDVTGINFPGERPWILRWDKIRQHVDYRGKRLLELGCNLSLLSIHARASGASRCMGIDIDEKILDAARMAARAFHMTVDYQQVDLDSGGRWEDDLQDFDIVSALSVMHWIKDKARVWEFLAKHREVIYEGHESEAEAERTLHRIGFDQIVRLGTTERGRQMFHASRTTD